MDDFTTQDKLNIECYQDFSTEDLIYTIEALHCIKSGELVDPLVEAGLYSDQEIQNTISVIREILIQRNAIQ